MTDTDGLTRTIRQLHALAQRADEEGDHARAEELRRVVKSYEAQLERA